MDNIAFIVYWSAETQPKKDRKRPKRTEKDGKDRKEPKKTRKGPKKTEKTEKNRKYPKRTEKKFVEPESALVLFFTHFCMSVCNIIFGIGNNPPPFGSFPKIHPFWWARASLIRGLCKKFRKILNLPRNPPGLEFSYSINLITIFWCASIASLGSMTCKDNLGIHQDHYPLSGVLSSVTL